MRRPLLSSSLVRLVVVVVVVASLGAAAMAAAAAGGAAAARGFDWDDVLLPSSDAPPSPSGRPAYDFPAFNEERAADEAAFLEAQQATMWPPEEELFERLLGGRDATAVVLDVGCGPGFLAERLLDAFAGVRVVCVEISFEYCRMARERLRDRVEEGRLRIVQGDANALDAIVRDGAADLAVARLVLQHVEDPADVVAGMARAARPDGGRVLLVDADDHLGDLVEPEVPSIIELVIANEDFEAGERTFRSDRHVGRYMQRFLRDAGLHGARQGVLSVSSEDDAFDARAALPMYDATLFRHLARRGLVEQALVDTAQREVERSFVEEPDEDAVLSFFLVAAWAERGAPRSGAVGRDEL